MAMYSHFVAVKRHMSCCTANVVCNKNPQSPAGYPADVYSTDQSARYHVCSGLKVAAIGHTIRVSLMYVTIVTTLMIHVRTQQCSSLPGEHCEGVGLDGGSEVIYHLMCERRERMGWV